jgi:NAD(P)-dependent dehydrogenase (short-subunit alcohol dehydrogenase family)
MADALRLYALKGLVTGAADGIGEAVARTFAKHGAQVLAVDFRDSRIATAFGKVQGISTLATDNNEKSAFDLMVGTVRERLKGLDILVNNFPDLADTSLADDEQEDGRTLERWLDRIAATTRSVLPLLKKSPAGRIINIGALRSTFGRNGDAAFAASERALAGLTASQAAEYGGFGITANYIQPGAIMTPTSRAVFESDRSFRDYCIARSAAKRLGEPVDVAKVALFLASDDSVFVSGTGIAADGGMLPDPS